MEENPIIVRVWGTETPQDEEFYNCRGLKVVYVPYLFIRCVIDDDREEIPNDLRDYVLADTQNWDFL